MRQIVKASSPGLRGGKKKFQTYILRPDNSDSDKACKMTVLDNAQCEVSLDLNNFVL